MPISVPVNGDVLSEADETFFVQFATPVNAVLGTAQAKATIVNDDPAPSFTIGTYGARKNVRANVTYIYRCSFLPLGIFWGQSGITAYCASLTAFPFYGGYTSSLVSGFVGVLTGTWRWNIPIHAQAVTDYWVS